MSQSSVRSYKLRLPGAMRLRTRGHEFELPILLNMNSTNETLLFDRFFIICDFVCFHLYYPQFWATVCKTVRPMLSDRCPVCLSVCLSVSPVCNVGALWPNGWIYHDETWRAGRPRPWTHCVRRGPSSPPPKGHSPHFSAHICCGLMGRWIKMPVGMA